MKAQLTPSWVLTTDHARSSYGIPVLLNHQTGEAFGPADIVNPYPSWGFQPAARVVERMAKLGALSARARELVVRFCGVAPGA